MLGGISSLVICETIKITSEIFNIFWSWQMYFAGQVPLYTTKKVHIKSTSKSEQFSIQLINTYYHLSGLNLLLPLEKMIG